MRLIRYLAWVWFIIIGALIITPQGIWCIKCGVVINAPGYIGDPATMVVAIGAIVLGLVGLVTEGARASAARGAAAG
ncbi:MAG TPA: hypothetical protein VI636_13370 [Candidatus Angelobacter sp.]